MSDLQQELRARPNPDIVKERANGTINIEKLKQYFGQRLFGSAQRHQELFKLREELVNSIQPIDYNFYNLDRGEQYDFCYKKALELLDFSDKHKISDTLENNFLAGPILACEKHLFTLHGSMVRTSIELWGTEEQRAFWIPKLKDYSIMATYAQTEIGHGTYVRGLETTATFDKQTDEFVLNSPTISSYKYWPGSLGITCNYAIIMAKLVIDNKDYGLHAFIVQLRDLDTHQALPNVEVMDIGKKFGFNSQDNGCLAFHSHRISRNHMLMNFAQVTRDGIFSRLGSELLMYGSMLLMRATLAMFAFYFMSISITIAIRYSTTRHQTANDKGVEPPVLDYQTQQYRLLPALACAYSHLFSAMSFRDTLKQVQKETNDLRDVSKSALAQLHAISSALKAYAFDNALKYAQICRLCCGGHGYSAASGLGQVILDADAGSTYEGDNVVLYLQTARYLLKCAQKGESPHYEFKNKAKFENTALFRHKLKPHFDKFYQLYDQAIMAAGEHLMHLVKEKNMTEYEAWNASGVLLINAAKIFIHIFVINSNLDHIYMYNFADSVDAEKQSLIDLFELYLFYSLSDTYAADLLKHNVISASEVKECQLKAFALLPTVRRNAVLLVDTFDLLDSNLASAIGCYDGNAYERLLDYARKSKFNTEKMEQFEKYLKPFVQKHKPSKL